MNILHVDIETAPHLAYVWDVWQQNISDVQMLEQTEMLCWAAKWDGDGEIYFNSKEADGKADMVYNIWSMLDTADVVVHYNGKRFDIPHLNREFLELGFAPPSTFKQVDLLHTVKSKFRFHRNKLDSVSDKLGIGNKVKHEGFDLWLKCMSGDADAWSRMEEYNKQDVLLLEKLFKKLRPWVSGLPNLALYSDDDILTVSCPACGSDDLRKKGFEYTSVSKFQRYVCKDCGKNARGRQNLADRENLLVGVG